MAALMSWDWQARREDLKSKRGEVWGMALVHLSVPTIWQPRVQECQLPIEYLGLIACGFMEDENHE